MDKAGAKNGTMPKVELRHSIVPLYQDTSEAIILLITRLQRMRIDNKQVV